MSTKNQILTILVFGLFLFSGWTLQAQQQDEIEDPVLEFYRQRAAGQIESRDPLEAGLTYRLHLRSYRYKLHRGGSEELTDSAAFADFYSFGKLDSQTVAYATKDDLVDADLSYPNVFAQTYQFNFYPNDTGDSALAIGFESDSANVTAPLGLAVIDRTRYFLMHLYLYYPSSAKYERYSRDLSFQQVEGYTFPDTVITTYALAGIFSVDYYRTETCVDSVRIER